MAFASDTADSRNLPASARREARARAAGLVPRSRLLSLAAQVGMLATAWAFGWPALAAAVQASLKNALRFDAASLQQADAGAFLWQATSAWALPGLAAWGAVLLGLALLAAVFSGGWNFSTQALAPQWARLWGGDTQGAWARRVAATSAQLLSLLLLALLAASLYWRRDELTLAWQLPLGAAAAAAGRAVGLALGSLAALLVVAAAVDVAWQRWQWARGLRMSVAEQRAEAREDAPARNDRPALAGRVAAGAPLAVNGAAR